MEGWNNELPEWWNDGEVFRKPLFHYSTIPIFHA
jgi:hypothetical protein